MVLHEVFIPPLQQQAHPYAPLRRMNQALAQLASGQKISIGNDDVLVRLTNGPAVGAFNARAVEQVVTQHQGGPGAGRAGQCCGLLHVLHPRPRRRLRWAQYRQPPPELRQQGLDFLHQGPAHPHHKIKTRQA